MTFIELNDSIRNSVYLWRRERDEPPSDAKSDEPPCGLTPYGCSNPMTFIELNDSIRNSVYLWRRERDERPSDAKSDEPPNALRAPGVRILWTVLN